MKTRKLSGSLSLLVTISLVGLSSAQDADISDTESADKRLAAEAEPLESGATMFPVPQYAGDLITREALTGDWGGVRHSLAREQGVQFAVDVNQFYFGVLDGGRSRESDYNGSADFRLKFDTEAAGLFPGGFLEVHGETYWGQSINGFTGAILPVNTDPVLSQPAGTGTYLPHVVYTQFLTEDLAVFFGKLDTTTGDANRFAHGVGDRGFSNLGFSFNPVTITTVPYSTLGAGFFLRPTDGVTLSVSAVDAEGTIDESGFDTVFSGNTTFAGELGIDTALLDKPGRHLFGYTWSNKEYLSTIQDPRILAPALGILPKVENDSWAFYYNFDQFLVTDPSDPSQGWGLFGRFGVSDGEANYIHRFYSGGIGGTGIIPGRDRDRFGAGYYYLQLTDNRLGLFTDDSEQGVEVFYTIAATPWFEVTTDLQVVVGAGRFSDTAVIGGFRARVVF